MKGGDCGRMAIEAATKISLRMDPPQRVSLAI
jgi:hypothetical protein